MHTYGELTAQIVPISNRNIVCSGRVEGCVVQEVHRNSLKGAEMLGGAVVSISP
jgi:hypothetical protein